MATIEYEKKYKEALGWMQSLYPTMTGADKEDAEHFFPELKESEDERIRKEIIELVMQPTWKTEKEFNRRNELCEWLEKQGKTSPVFSNSSNIGKVEQKPAFEIKTPEESLGIDSDTYNKVVDECVYGEHKPDVDQHSLPVSDDSSLPTFNEDMYHPCTEKSYDWSEEDEKEMATIEHHLNNCGASITSILWLKSLKDRYTWKPSDEQMDILQKLCEHNSVVTLTKEGIEAIESLYQDLKKLK